MMTTRSVLWRFVLALALTLASCGSRKLPSDDDGGASKQPPRPDVTLDGHGPCARWSCTGDAVGDTCRADFPALPHGTGPWRCHQAKGSWFCDGRRAVGGAPMPPPPLCTEGWSCSTVATVGESPNGRVPSPGYDELLRCSRPISALDRPPTNKPVACVRGTAFGGLRCTIVAEPPKPPTVEAKPHERCTPGEKQWCDGLQYSGWGQITCQQDGRWPTRTINGKAVKDCQELSSGARPDTLCACYHPYGGALECCERADCKVVRRDDGSESTQICPKSGGTGCEYCSPQKKQCGSQRTCAITKSGEAYCTEPCGFLCTCPEGYSWEMVGETAYCLPEDRSCYY